MRDDRSAVRDNSNPRPFTPFGRMLSGRSVSEGTNRARSSFHVHPSSLDIWRNSLGDPMINHTACTMTTKITFLLALCFLAPNVHAATVSVDCDAAKTIQAALENLK